MAGPSERIKALWEQLPDEVRHVARDTASVAGAELRRIRRPRDARRLLRDPEFFNRLTEPLAPALDRLAEAAARGTLPISARAAYAAAGTAGFLGAAAGSVLEIASLLEIEIPPVAISTASAAGAIAVVGELVEFYVVASHVRYELEQGGAFEPSTLRAVLVETYLGRVSSDGGLLPSLWPRMAGAIARRMLPRLVPVAGVAWAPVSSVRTVQRARAAVQRTMADRAAAESRNASGDQ
ncbi:MAG TPA: hypothetical protein VE991_13735 [Acidimicrobiales bacterium]|nr:hypothetical protein [Acidimicrobiales bacterium]